MNRQIDLKQNFFYTPNALIHRTNTSHTIAALLQPQKNLQLRVIVIARQAAFKTKKGDIVQYLVADQTASCLVNFYNQTAKTIREGDVLYLSGVYSSLYKDMLIVYEGTCSLVRRIAKFNMRFNLSKNMSVRNEVIQS